MLAVSLGATVTEHATSSTSRAVNGMPVWFQVPATADDRAVFDKYAAQVEKYRQLYLKGGGRATDTLDRLITSTQYAGVFSKWKEGEKVLAGQKPFVRFMINDVPYGKFFSLLKTHAGTQPASDLVVIKTITIASHWYDAILDAVCGFLDSTVGKLAVAAGVGAVCAFVSGGMGFAGGFAAGKAGADKAAKACGIAKIYIEMDKLLPQAPPEVAAVVQTITPAVPLPVGPAALRPLPAKPPVTAFPAGTVARWHVGERTWWVYAPGKAFEGGFGDALGDAPAPDAKVAGTEASVPAGATRGPDIGRPWYRDWRYLLPIGAGVVAVGAGGYLLMRRR